MHIRPHQHRSANLRFALLAVLLAGGGIPAAHAQVQPTTPEPALVRSHQKIDARIVGSTSRPGEPSGFGWSIEPLGDFDGNGVPDLAVGVHYDDVGAEDAGSICLVLMQADGTVARILKINATSGGFAGPLGLDDVFGWSIASLGDLDGNGIVDLAVGAPGDDDSGTDVGAVYILFLTAEGRVLRQQKISAREPWARRRPWTWIIPRVAQGGFFAAVEPLENFGVAVEPLGDLDGDGVVDLAVGARSGGDSGNLRGSVWILFLARDGSVRDHRRLDANTPALRDALREKDEFGFALSTVGDLDGDGILELAVGARGDDDGGLDHGAVYVLFLDRDGDVRQSSKISSSSGNFDGHLGTRFEFGVSVAAVSDLSGDGLPELVVGTRGDDQLGPFAGAAWLLGLGPDGRVQQSRKITSGTAGFDGRLDRWDRFGSGMAMIGDIDHDGFPELVVGAEGDDDAAMEAGALWILHLHAPKVEP